MVLKQQLVVHQIKKGVGVNNSSAFQLLQVSESSSGQRVTLY